MAPGVVAHFVTLGDYPTQDVSMATGVVTDDVESGLDVPLGEHVEETRCVLGVWPIVEGDSNEWF